MHWIPIPEEITARGNNQQRALNAQVGGWYGSDQAYYRTLCSQQIHCRQSGEGGRSTIKEAERHNSQAQCKDFVSILSQVNQL